MRKRLVFHFYYNKKYNEDPAYAYHIFCLSKYISIFDDIDFFISLDDVDDINSIRQIEEKILSLKIKGNISFHVVENNLFQEAQTFYDCIVKKLGNYEGLTFFGHVKGISNLKNENITYWIAALYFFNLQPIDEVNETFRQGFATYGNPAVVIERKENKFAFTRYSWFNSSGTFFWINERELKALLEFNKREILPLTNRYYAENFISNHFDVNQVKFGFHKCMGTNMTDFYGDAKRYIEIIYGTDYLWNDFLKFHENMIKLGNNCKFIEI